MNIATNITARRAAPATDYHGELMDALSMMQCVYVILDRGERLHVDTCMDLMVLINSAQEKVRPVADMLADGVNS